MSPQESVIQRLRFLQRSIGPSGLVRRVAAKLAAPVYKHFDYYVANAYLDTVTIPEYEELRPDSVRGHVVDALPAFDALPGRFHPHLSPEQLRSFLEEKPRRFLLLAEYMRPDGEIEYVGYRTLEQGYFEIAKALPHGSLPDNYAMIYHNEVAPDYRGRGFAEIVRGALFAHCKKIGVNRITSVIAVHNVASLRAQTKRVHGDIAAFPGRISWSVWFGGLLVRGTPWEEVLSVVQSPPPDLESESRDDS